MNNDVFNLVRQSVLDHSVTDDERRLEALRITEDKELPPMHFLFRIFGKPCFPRGELVAVTGKAKSGKTLFNSMLMTCCVSYEALQVARMPEQRNGTWECPPMQCLWYDTEQSEQSTQDILKNRILRMVDEGKERLHVFNVRCLHWEERMRLFRTAVLKYRPQLVVLDGVRDLLSDINDGVRAQEMVEELMKLAQEADCCMVCVLHQNKGAEDRNPRGWVGTELMNKAFEVYACEKMKPENIFMVEQTHTRKYDLGELMFFRMDPETELPVVCDAPARLGVTPAIAAEQQGERLPHMNSEYLTFDENNRPHPKMDELFYEALKAGPLYYTEMQKRVLELLNCGTPMWNHMFNVMRKRGAIVRTINREGKAVWQLSSTSVRTHTTQSELCGPLADFEGVSPTS